uniref:E-beta-farnesene synthase n=1 Tax=Tanacetum cinerariifolium TaxID=118510 RepID=A0A6L2JI49_TANCI|nr:E-beta-farnesene synthase [Tanacetum cinerariifolium]
MAPPTRTDDQILPHIRWVPIGKSNCYLDVENSQSNPIYKIADTIRYDKTVECYKCQLDEQWFDLTKDTLKDALQITPVNNNKSFSFPPYSDALINFINELGYLKLVRNLSNVSVVNRAYIDYAERVWEEFTQSVHTFIEDKKNLAQHTHGKKKSTLIVIPSIRFTKLIIYYLQRKHKFHLRPDSLLYLPNEEPVLRYLKFSAKKTKREVFGKPIPGNLITANIQGEPYYQEYLEKVVRQQRYLAGEQGSDPDSPAQKPTKVTKKSKPSAPKADLRPPVTKPASSQQPEPKPTPAKSQGKKLDESVAEDILEKEPRVNDEEVDVQRALEESLKSIYDAPRVPLPPMVIREPESEKYQPLPEVQGKGKEKVTDEQVSIDLLTLQMPKKKSLADQFIFQRRTSTPTGSFGHDESSSLYVEFGLTYSKAGPNLDEQDEGQAGPNLDDAAASQPLPSLVVHAGPNLEHMDLKVTDVSTQPHPKQMDEGFTATAYPKVQENLKLMVEEQVILEEPASSTGTLSSLQHLTKDLSFGDLFFNDKPSEADNKKTNAETKVESMVSVTIQQDTSPIPPMTTPIVNLTSRPDSPNVHQPLQATATETTTTTTTIHPPPPQPQQSATDSMLMKRISELEHIMANLIQDNKHLEEMLDSHGARLYTLENLDIPQQRLTRINMKEILHQRLWETNSYKTHEDHMMLYEALEKSMNRDHSEELLKDLAEARKKKKKRRDSPKMPLGSPPHQPPPPSPAAGPSGTSCSPRASGSSQVPPPPPPPPSTNQEGQSYCSTTLSSSKTAASAEYKAWTMTDTRLRLSVSSTPKDLQMDDDMAPDVQAYSYDDEDIENAHIPKLNLRQDWWKPLEKDRPAWSIPSSDVPMLKNKWASALAFTYSPPLEDSLLAQTGDIAMFMDWFCKRQGIIKLKPQYLEGPAFELVKVFHPNVIHLRYQMEESHKLLTDSVDDSIIRHNVSKPLPLGGPPGQVTFQSNFFFNKDLKYLRYGSKGSIPTLSISKMKAAYYPDVGLEQMVPDQMWIEEECKHTSEGDCRAVRTHIGVLSFVKIEVFSMYGYDYIKKIVLRRADLNEHIIAERDFKYLYPSDFEDLYLLNLQGHLNHLPPKDKKILATAVNLWTRHLVIRQRVEDFQVGIESYQTQLNLTKPRWDATGFEYKHDYTALHYRVKEFKVNRMNSGLNTRFWTRKDVDRSKEFMFASQKRLKTRRIFRNLESFVGGRVSDGDYRLLKGVE